MGFAWRSTESPLRIAGAESGFEVQDSGRLVAGVMLLSASACAPGKPVVAALAPPSIEARTSLGLIKGRIDHLALDEARGHLFVAEAGDDSVGVIDLGRRRLTTGINGLSEPQGLGFVAPTDNPYVANGRDGLVRLFAGTDFKPTERVDLGRDADDVRADSGTDKVFVEYGEGTLAVIDAKTRTVLSRIPLQGHPEGFQLGSNGAAIYVNLPGAHRIAVVGRRAGKQSASLPVGMSFANYPTALDDLGHRLAAAFHPPPQLEVFDLNNSDHVLG